MDLFGVHAVNRPFGLGQDCEDGDGPFFHTVFKRAFFDHRSDFAEGVGRMACVTRILGAAYIKPLTGQTRGVMRRNLDHPVLGQPGRADGKQRAVAKVGTGIQHRGQKHISGNTADGIEMNVHAWAFSRLFYEPATPKNAVQRVR